MRWVLRVVVAVVVGVVVNVGVAWGLAAVPRDVSWRGERGAFAFSSGEVTAFSRWRFFGFDRMQWISPRYWSVDLGRDYPEARAPWWSGVGLRKEWPREFPLHMRNEVAAGWPMRSMRVRCFVTHVPTVIHLEPARTGLVLTKPARVRGFGSEVDALPLVPVWSGFVVNTIVWGAVGMMVLMTPGWVVRRRRRKRGLCEGCGYPRGDMQVCPECGKK